jgi:DNA-binding HxlR family transcriptional regulator
MTDDPASGWELLAEDDEGARVIAGLLALDPASAYTRSELGRAAGIPLKTLYLVETLDNLESAGMLERVDDAEAETETRYRINSEHPVYETAQEFDRVFAEHVGSDD